MSVSFRTKTLDTEMKQKSTYLFFFLPAALLLSLAGCHKAPVAEAGGTAEIGIRPVTAGMSKATFYSTDVITTVDLKIFAYLHGTATAFIDGDKYHYIPAFSDWRFYQGASIVHHYWPIVGSVWNSTDMDGHLDFAGYLPYDLSNTGVTLGTYTAGNPAFHADLSELPYASYSSQKEFLYAYTDDQTAAGGEVEMEFHHPFASVYFVLDVAPRGTVINSVTLTNIYREADFAHTDSPQWSGHDQLGTYSVTGINKTIPNQLNYGQTIGGPYLVVPQTLNHQTESVYDTAISVHYTDALSVEHDAAGVIGGAAVVWAPGTAYTYSLSIGDRSDDGILNVTVTSWIIEGASTSDID